MIVDLIVQILVGIVTGILSLIPAYSLPNLSGFGGALGANLKALDGYFPVSTLGISLVAIIGARVLVWGFHVALLIYDVIPFKAT
jgi:hypothetical protein